MVRGEHPFSDVDAQADPTIWVAARPARANPARAATTYRMRDDQWYEATVFKTAALRRFKDVLAEGVELVGADGPAGRRLAETQEFFAFFRAELPGLLERWRATRSAGTA